MRKESLSTKINDKILDGMEWIFDRLGWIIFTIVCMLTIINVTLLYMREGPIYDWVKKDVLTKTSIPNMKTDKSGMTHFRLPKDCQYVLNVSSDYGNIVVCYLDNDRHMYVLTYNITDCGKSCVLHKQQIDGDFIQYNDGTYKKQGD